MIESSELLDIQLGHPPEAQGVAGPLETLLLLGACVGLGAGQAPKSPQTEFPLPWAGQAAPCGGGAPTACCGAATLGHAGAAASAPPPAAASAAGPAVHGLSGQPADVEPAVGQAFCAGAGWCKASSELLDPEESSSAV
mmetsp:Transcript_62273/g.131650  ORF Transcript_62273/g.131650 Transcript_62273/m.131650 type:complete len:139 (-) Transcript_62273:1429-1845(-)